MSVYPLLSTEEEGWQGASVPAPSGLFGELMTLVEGNKCQSSSMHTSMHQAQI